MVSEIYATLTAATLRSSVFHGEHEKGKTWTCCRNGRVVVPPVPQFPFMRDLLTVAHGRREANVPEERLAKFFLNNIRAFNNAFCMAFPKANEIVAPGVNGQAGVVIGGTYCTRISDGYENANGDARFAL